jgi:hypothetical protein
MPRLRMMEWSREAPDAMRPVYWLLLGLSLVPLCLVVPMAPAKTGVVALAGWIALLWVAICFLRNQFHLVVLAWVAVYPYCYYFLSYPVERSIFTVDRAFILLLTIELVLAYRRGFAVPLTRDIRISAYLWATYLFVCLVSIWGHAIPEILGSYRLLVDGMLMPALLGLYAIRVFPISQNLKKTHLCVCILMIGIAILTGTELLRGENLLPANGAVEEWVPTREFKILRVDGPFENSGVLCLTGTLGFFLIVYLRSIGGTSFQKAQRCLHWVSVLCALAVAFMPMNRGLVIALVACACVDYLAKFPLISRRIWNSIFAGLLILAGFARIFYAEVYDDRVSRPDNFYQRLAQDMQTLEVVRDHPLIGIGFNLYHDQVLGDAQYSVRFKGFEAMDYPHNSLFAVLAEEGGIGFILYIAAQIFFVRAMWRLRKVNELGFRVFLYSVLVYTIYGLDVGMAYYSDLNLFYMLVLGIVLQVQLRMSQLQIQAQ